MLLNLSRELNTPYNAMNEPEFQSNYAALYSNYWEQPPPLSTQKKGEEPPVREPYEKVDWNKKFIGLQSTFLQTCQKRTLTAKRLAYLSLGTLGITIYVGIWLKGHPDTIKSAFAVSGIATLLAGGGSWYLTWQKEFLHDPAWMRKRATEIEEEILQGSSNVQDDRGEPDLGHDAQLNHNSAMGFIEAQATYPLIQKILDKSEISELLLVRDAENSEVNFETFNQKHGLGAVEVMNDEVLSLAQEKLLDWAKESMEKLNNTWAKDNQKTIEVYQVQNEVANAEYLADFKQLDQNPDNPDMNYGTFRGKHLAFIQQAQEPRRTQLRNHLLYFSYTYQKQGLGLNEVLKCPEIYALGIATKDLKPLFQRDFEQLTQPQPESDQPQSGMPYREFRQRNDEAMESWWTWLENDLEKERNLKNKIHSNARGDVKDFPGNVVPQSALQNNQQHQLPPSLGAKALLQQYLQEIQYDLIEKSDIYKLALPKQVVALAKKRPEEAFEQFLDQNGKEALDHLSGDQRNTLQGYYLAMDYPKMKARLETAGVKLGVEQVQINNAIWQQAKSMNLEQLKRHNIPALVNDQLLNGQQKNNLSNQLLAHLASPNTPFATISAEEKTMEALGLEKNTVYTSRWSPCDLEQIFQNKAEAKAFCQFKHEGKKEAVIQSIAKNQVTMRELVVKYSLLFKEALEYSDFQQQFNKEVKKTCPTLAAVNQTYGGSHYAILFRLNSFPVRDLAQQAYRTKDIDPKVAHSKEVELAVRWKLVSEQLVKAYEAASEKYTKALERHKKTEAQQLSKLNQSKNSVIKNWEVNQKSTSSTLTEFENQKSQAAINEANFKGQIELANRSLSDLQKAQAKWVKGDSSTQAEAIQQIEIKEQELTAQLEKPQAQGILAALQHPSKEQKIKKELEQLQKERTLIENSSQAKQYRSEKEKAEKKAAEAKRKLDFLTQQYQQEKQRISPELEKIEQGKDTALNKLQSSYEQKAAISGRLLLETKDRLQKQFSETVLNEKEKLISYF